MDVLLLAGQENPLLTWILHDGRAAEALKIKETQDERLKMADVSVSAGVRLTLHNWAHEPREQTHCPRQQSPVVVMETAIVLNVGKQLEG